MALESVQSSLLVLLQFHVLLSFDKLKEYAILVVGLYFVLAKLQLI